MSLGSILSVAAPIAAGYFTGGAGGTSLFGLEATGSAIAAGALTGAGIAALSGGDILTSAAMGGLGGYGGGELGAAFNPAGASGIASATGTTNAAVNQAAMSNMTGSALGQGGFNTAAGRGLMGVATPGMAGAAGAGANTGLQNVTAQNTGQGFSPYATPDTLGESVTQFSADAAYNAANPNLGIDVSDVVKDRITGQVAGPNFDSLPRLEDFPLYEGAQTPDFANIVKSTPQELAANQARQAVDTSFSAGVERLGDGSMSKGAMKLGLAGLPVLAAAYEPETFTYDQMKEAEAYDPDETLNLLDPELDSGIEDVIDEDSGLRLYANQGGMVPAYAEGGTIESRANQGMRDALARNKGTAYTQPTTAYTPTTAPSNNIRIAGADNSTSNIRGGVGSLNVGSGTIGQSPNAIAEAARLKAIEDAKPKIRVGPSMAGSLPVQYKTGGIGGIGGGRPSRPTGWFGINQGRVYAPGYAEGGTIESRANQGMRDALARNKGTAYTQPTTAYTPTTAPSNNIKIAGADNSTTNLTGGVGSLNVGSGSIGQSPNAIAEAARLKAIEDAKPKYTTPTSGANVGGAGGQGSFSVPSELVMGQGYMPTGAIMQGPAQNYYRDIAGNFIRRAQGGIIPAAYAEGGMLEGPGDGMSDSLAAQIDGSQPAALSQGEFVVPADVVSHLGNGSSDAGSKRLYAMMDEVRNARTGTKKQGKEINPERYMPA